MTVWDTYQSGCPELARNEVRAVVVGAGLAPVEPPVIEHIALWAGVRLTPVNESRPPTASVVKVYPIGIEIALSVPSVIPTVGSRIVVPVNLSGHDVVSRARILLSIPVTGAVLVLLTQWISVVVPVSGISVVVDWFEIVPDGIDIECQQQSHDEGADAEDDPGGYAMSELSDCQFGDGPGLAVQTCPDGLAERSSLGVHHESPPIRYPSSDSRLSSGFSITETSVSESTMTRGRMA